MHQLNVLILGPNSFTSTLIELKSYLKFNLYVNTLDIDKLKTTLDIIIVHDEALVDNQKSDLLINNSTIKVFATSKKRNIRNRDALLKLPTTIDEINSIIEQSVAKNVFNKNSSIKIKEYSLNKNEKKLIKNSTFIILTEKEIQLLELFLNQTKPISKNKILSLVWHYSNDADTHTVETHIYRLRKKVDGTFSDVKFILNNKDGYYI